MGFCPGSSVLPSVPPGTPRTHEAAEAQRVNQAQYVEEHLEMASHLQRWQG